VNTYFYYQGATLDKLGSVTKAIQCYNKAIELNPFDERFYLAKGNIMEDSNEAIKCFDKAIQINPLKDVYYYNKGLCFNILKKYDDAFQCFNKAIELNPTDADYMIELGDSYSRYSGLQQKKAI
jgi:tetratricopeptide (TPR) repeat protein